MHLFSIGALYALFGGTLGAAVLWSLFHIFCRYYLKAILVDSTIHNPDCIESVKTQIQQGIDRVVAAFKKKMPMVGMFLGAGKEAELKQVAVEELIGKVPNVPPQVFEGIANEIQKKGALWVVLAGFVVGAVCGIFFAAITAS